MDEKSKTSENEVERRRCEISPTILDNQIFKTEKSLEKDKDGPRKLN